MYLPPAFTETNPAELRMIIRDAPLPVIVSQSLEGGGLVATHLPLTLEGNRLIGHFAKANAHWTRFDGRQDSIAIFVAAEGYVSPSFYAAKAEHGRVVPTWNYEAVHVYGRLEILKEPGEILPIVTALTERYETKRAHPWAVGDAPADYIAAQLKGIVGVVLHVSKIEGKRKLNQNRSEEDRLGVIAGLAEENAKLAAAMKRTME